MKAKLQDYMDKRLPIFLRERNGYIYYQLQVEVAREDGLCAGMYHEFDKISADSSPEEIGMIAKRYLARFHETGDLSLEEFGKLTGSGIEEYKAQQHASIMSFVGVKDNKALERNFRECSIRYRLKDDSYDLVLTWCYKSGRRYWNDSSDSTGREGILTFEPELKFDDNVSAEDLGNMIMEAFRRSAGMSKVMSK